jgi:hypothetical protein
LKGLNEPRHYLRMKALFLLPLIVGICAAADEGANTAAIERTIAQVNRLPWPDGLFTADSDAPPVLEDLWKGKRLVYRLGTRADEAGAFETDRPHVVISHEPWGEATIEFPGVPAAPALEVVNPRIVNRTVRYLAPDEAVAEADSLYRDRNGDVQTTPLSFVMKKEDGRWKIASLRVLAPQRRSPVRNR